MPLTPADVKQVKALTRTVAKEMFRQQPPPFDATVWIERRPQCLWPLLDATVAACTAGKREVPLIAACRWLLVRQLEVIRYQLERRHDWARAMLDAYQEELILLARSSTLPEPDWFVLVNLLNEAKVPIRPEMAEALRRATTKATQEKSSATGDMAHAVGSVVDELGSSAEDPFLVVEGLAETGTLMPPELRAYLTHELGFSRHAVLREALPLLLLDPESLVRQAAAAALEQIANPEMFSPVMLRRTLLVRNWVPNPERDGIDRLVRKARLKGVACAQWAPFPTTIIQASGVDGSGAQSLILTTPAGRTGLFAGILLKQGYGVRDAWCDASVPRREITRSLKQIPQELGWLAIGRDHLDILVQHHIASGLTAGNLPLMAIVAIAEAVGAADWKDRRLNMAAEIERLFVELGTEVTTEAAIVASMQRSNAWLAEHPMMQSWFEDDAAILDVVEGRPRPKPDMVVKRVLETVLASRRSVWAERLLLLALWLRAGTGKPMSVVRWQDCVVLAHALLGERPLATMLPMVTIAKRSVLAARARRF